MNRNDFAWALFNFFTRERPTCEPKLYFTARLYVVGRMLHTMHQACEDWQGMGAVERGAAHLAAWKTFFGTEEGDGQNDAQQ